MKKWVLVLLVAAVVAGCGIEWFPDDTGTADGNNNNVSFSFAGKNQCSVLPGSTVVSSPIDIFGLVTTASISVSTNNNGQYAIDSGGFTNVPGTIRPGQTVKVSHQAASENSASRIVVTTLTVGGRSASFKSTIDPCAQGTNTFE